MNISEMTALGSIIITVLSNIIWVAAWYVGNQKSSEVKKYAAERDFGHLKNNQLQISESIHVLLSEVEKDFNALNPHLAEIKIIHELLEEMKTNLTALNRDILEIKIKMGIDKNV